MGHRDQLLHMPALSTRREVAILSNTYRQTQRDRQDEQADEYVPNQGKSQKETLMKQRERSYLIEFKVMVIRMLTDLRRRIDEHSENLNKEAENTRKYQTEIITELRNTREGFNSRMGEREA